MKAICYQRGSPKLCTGPDSKTCWTGKMEKSDCPIVGYHKWGRDHCWTYYTYYGMATPEPYRNINLSAIRRLTQPLETDAQLTRILNTTYQYIQGETNLTNPCQLCLPLQQGIFLATPVPDEANRMALLGPVAENVFMKVETNLTCVQSPGGSLPVGNLSNLLCTTTVNLLNTEVQCAPYPEGSLPVGNLSNLPCTTTVNLLNTEVQCAPYPGYLLPMWQTGKYLFRQKLDRVCIRAFIIPETSVATDQEIEMALNPYYQSKQAVLLPLLVGTGIAGIGTRIGGISTSAHFFHKLSWESSEDMERVANSLMSLQNQLNSLAAMVLQNHRALDLWLKKGEECCYCVNQSGIVTGKVKELRDRIQRRCTESESLWDFPGLGT
ncbi:Syncytin-1 [Plecturocebus cupreus]